MGLFRKEGEDVLDLTLLQRKGILRKAREIEASQNTMAGHSNDVIDLTQAQQASSQPANTNASPLSFFDSVSPPASSVSSDNNPAGNDLSSMKIKIDDLEYKLDKFLERLEQLDSKINEVSKNIR